MESIHSKRTQAVKSTKKSSSGKERTKKSALNICDNAVLNRVLKHLSKEKKKARESLPKKRCPVEDRSERRVDHQVKLKCRQLPNVVLELRRALMRHDWDYVATLAMILCHPGVKYYAALILKVCFILLLNHPKSNFGLLQNFIRLTTGYILEEDVNKFIRILFVLGETPLRPLGRGKYIRKASDYKVTRDPKFENL